MKPMRLCCPLWRAAPAHPAAQHTAQRMRIFTATAIFTFLPSSSAAATTGSLYPSPLLHQRRAVGQSSTLPGASLSLSEKSSTAGSSSPVARESSVGNRDAAKEGPPSLEPVIVELGTLVTRTMPVGELFRALSPASRKILVAHRLPLEELLLHFPNHFLVCRLGEKRTSQSATLHVAPPSCAKNNMHVMRLPPGTKPLPALEQWLGPQKAMEVAMPNSSIVGGSPCIGTGSGFVGNTTTLKERLEEVLTYIPNEWVAFSSLNISRDVKMRCMGYPLVRPCAFLLKYPQFFDVRVQDRNGNSFLVRRALSLQQQLNRTRKP
ncbi:hypothetical protein conserved [Leishmania donovani]|uniref:Uncharacterized protein n=3 Tax=Leishmania donovani species complex TaxID=38574 RepID=A4I1M1_LEIIN|nr:conserved hypothetical protein [Leishmania infantum JPCM5]CAC9494735.1 hypothetical_protein_-_conserved [Leishmania infantum]CAJ1989507.1 hypothetical protein conserved [Leishmania donovani]CAM68651.1 conserved hypothetical protein [Leishmania infantum JPCM5]SUZ42510.1 hypothetical_protein_-_conserved [Leishmania infantum]VDZ45373.1 hypothetical_protein_conserved [Leishmania donovani]|eukprot:XP_001466212.1 conserved hypothetical protein [Leishmania infantum JPCM5]